MASVISRLRGIQRTPTSFAHSGHEYPLGAYPGGSLPGSPSEVSFANFTQSIQSIHSRSGPVAAAIAARSLVLSQIVFKFRPLRDEGRLFGTEALGPLENPGDDLTRFGLLTRVEPDVAYAGNFYLRRLADGRLRRLRPDWVQILIGSQERPEDVRLGADAEVIGYVYKPGGPTSKHPGQILYPSEVAHWAPEPHPLSNFIGEAWVSQVWREIAADMQATDHVSKFFENAATANMIMTAPPTVVTREQFDQWADAMDAAHKGAFNAWKTIYTEAGTDAQVVGSQIGELKMADLQGGFETRVSARSRVPATVLLIREGLGGSALNAGNYQQTRRLWADSWFTPYAQGFCSSLQRLINTPRGAELTFDPRRIMLLQEDQQDAAEILSRQMLTIESAVRAGYKPESAVDAVTSGDLTRLEHTGLYSVQLQPPGSGEPPAPQE